MLNTANDYSKQQFESAIKQLSELKFTLFWGGSEVVRAAINNVERQIAAEDIFYTEAELEEKRKREQQEVAAVAATVVREQERQEAQKQYNSFFEKGSIFNPEKIQEVEKFLEKNFEQMKPHARAYLGEQVIKNSTPAAIDLALKSPKTREAMNEYMDLKNGVEVLLKENKQNLSIIFNPELIAEARNLKLDKNISGKIEAALKSNDKDALYQIAKDHFPKDLQDEIIQQAKKSELELRVQRNPELFNKAIDSANQKITDQGSKDKLEGMKTGNADEIDLKKAKEMTKVLEQNGVRKEVGEEIKDAAVHQDAEKSQQKQPEKNLAERSTEGSKKPDSKLQAAVEELKKSGVTQVATADRQQTEAELPNAVSPELQKAAAI